MCRASFTPKPNKDLAQAGALLGWFKIYRPWEAEEAWQDVIGRGKGWVNRVERGMKALDRWAPELGVGDWLKRPYVIRHDEFEWVVWIDTPHLDAGALCGESITIKKSVLLRRLHGAGRGKIA